MSQNIMAMIVVGLALFMTLSTQSVAESETQPNFVVIKTLLKVLTIKLWRGFRIHFQLLNSCFQLLIIVTKHSVYDETGFIDQSLAFVFCESQ